MGVANIVGVTNMVDVTNIVGVATCMYDTVSIQLMGVVHMYIMVSFNCFHVVVVVVCVSCTTHV